MKRFVLVALLAACGPNTTAEVPDAEEEPGERIDARPAGPDADLNVYPDGGTTSTAAYTYTDPAAGASLRLVVDPAASTGNTIVLNLVAARALTGYSVGFNLPLDATKVKLVSFTPGTALNAGLSPTAAKVALPTSGPLKGVLVAAQSQKAAGAGAVPGDTAIAAGAVLFSIKLDPPAGATPGVVFDGAALSPRFSGGLRDKEGTDVVLSRDVKIGKLVKK